MFGSFSNVLRHQCPKAPLAPNGRLSAEDLDLRTLPDESGGNPTVARMFRFAITAKFDVEKSPDDGATETRLHIQRLIRQFQFTLPGVPPLWHVTGDDLIRILAVLHYGRISEVIVNADGPTVRTHPAGAIHGTWLKGDAGTVEVIWLLQLPFVLPRGRRPQDISLPTKLLQCASKFEFSWGRAEDLGTRNDNKPLTTGFSGTVETSYYYESVPALELPILAVFDSLSLVGTQPSIAPVVGRYVAAGLYRPEDSGLQTGEVNTLGVRWGSRVYSEDTTKVQELYLDPLQMAEATFHNWLPFHTDSNHQDHSAAAFLPVYLPPCGRDGVHLTQLQDGRAQLRLKMDHLNNVGTRLFRVLALWHGTELEQIRRLIELPHGAKVKAITASHKPHPDQFVNRNGLPFKVTGEVAGDGGEV